MPRTIAIGEQDFSKMIEGNIFYVDKTSFLKEWWENKDSVTLITRPRRFGKTLTMSMVDYFFSIKHADKSSLFENLDIWEEAYYDVCDMIAREYRRHRFLLKSDSFLPTDQDRFNKLLSGGGNLSDVCASINLLSEYLYEYYGKKVIILLDEYDTPMQEAYSNGYWDQLVAFMRKFMNETFKTNPYLERGLMTGITRVSKESVFSDLNHPVVITTATTMYETAFGFTENEVFQALTEYHLQDKAEEAKRWYDGFRFGDCSHIYNPWSVINYLKYKRFAPYWANTSSNTLVGKLIQGSNREIKMIVEELLKGKSFKAVIDEQVVFDQLENDSNALWSFLLASGYLKIVRSMISTPFMIMMFRQNARAFPIDIIEAARIDGLNEIQIFFRMFFPTMRSTYAAAAVITFMNSWNAYLWPKVIMTDGKSLNMVMLIANTIGGYKIDYGMIMMGVLFCSIPTMIVFFVLQKQFAEGITGAVK